MLCKRCMVVMMSGTTYDQRKDGKPFIRRFHECKKCHDKVYTKEPNFQECLNIATEKCRKR